MIKINPKDKSIREIYHLMISAISPRPIALVGTVDKTGIHNLAPFSFFNGFGANPPIVGFSPANSGKTGLPKDTLLNIKETCEFTISIVNKEIVDQVSLSSCDYARGVDEFEKAGLTKLKSSMISPFGVKESPIIMECKLYNLITLGDLPASGNLILGEIVFFHIASNIFEDGKINSKKINHVGRSGGSLYVESNNAFFEVEKPTGQGIGFDNLPQKLLVSSLKGNQLAKLASISSIPILISNHKYDEYAFSDIITCLSKHIDNNEIEQAWQVFLNWDYNNNG